MKKLIVKLTTASLLFGMTAGAFSCGEAAEPTDVTDAQSSDSTTEASQLEVKDFGGYNVRILTRADTGTGTWFTLDVTAEEENGDAINDAVFRRNQKIEEDYNITIERISEEGADHVNLITQSVLAGDDTYDLVLSYL